MDKKDEQFPETDSDKVVEGAQRGDLLWREVSIRMTSATRDRCPNHSDIGKCLAHITGSPERQ